MAGSVPRTGLVVVSGSWAGQGWPARCPAPARRRARVALRAAAEPAPAAPPPPGGPSVDPDDNDDRSDARGSSQASQEGGGSKLEEIIATRRAKVAELRDAGVEPYPVGFAPTSTLAGVRERYPDLEPQTDTADAVTVAGRIISIRRLGKLTFLVLREDGV